MVNQIISIIFVILLTKTINKMKKIILIILTLSLMLASCTKDKPMEPITPEDTVISIDDDTTDIDNVMGFPLTVKLIGLKYNELDSIVIYERKYDTSTLINYSLKIDSTNFIDYIGSSNVIFDSRRIKLDDTFTGTVGYKYRVVLYLNTSLLHIISNNAQFGNVEYLIGAPASDSFIYSESDSTLTYGYKDL